MIRFLYPAAILAATSSVALGDEPLVIESVLLAPAEQVEVPSQESGILTKLVVREGGLVTAGQLLAQVDDADARLEKARAEIELTNSMRLAKNDIKIRVMQKSLEVAKAELHRAREAQKRYPKSVSGTELDHLQLKVEHASLEVEQAKYDQETAGLAVQVNRNSLLQADRQIDRRKIVSPIDGRVEQVLRRAGEWVQPGQSVLRVLRVDRIKVLGFLPVEKAVVDLVGRPAKLGVTLNGKIRHFQGEVTFVSSEVNPVNGQVDLWAEVNDPDLALRPGLRGTLVIESQNERVSSKP